MSSASALQPAGGLGPCGSENLLPKAWAQAPSSPQPRGPPRPSSSVRIILAVRQAQPQQMTPHTASDVDVVFKLSLRRKRKQRDNKERKWPGPAHPVSLVRPPTPPPPPQLPPPSPAEAANNADQFLCLSKRTQVRDTGGVEHTGGGPTTQVPIGVRRRTQASRWVCRKWSAQSQGTCCPSMLVARK